VQFKIIKKNYPWLSTLTFTRNPYFPTLSNGTGLENHYTLTELLFLQNWVDIKMHWDWKPHSITVLSGEHWRGEHLFISIHQEPINNRLQHSLTNVKLKMISQVAPLSDLNLFSFFISSKELPTLKTSALVRIGDEAVSWSDSAKSDSLVSGNTVNTEWNITCALYIYTCTVWMYSSRTYSQQVKLVFSLVLYMKHETLSRLILSTFWLVFIVKDCDWKEIWDSKEYSWE